MVSLYSEVMPFQHLPPALYSPNCCIEFLLECRPVLFSWRECFGDESYCLFFAFHNLEELSTSTNLGGIAANEDRLSVVQEEELGVCCHSPLCLCESPFLLWSPFPSLCLLGQHVKGSHYLSKISSKVFSKVVQQSQKLPQCLDIIRGLQIQQALHSCLQMLHSSTVDLMPQKLTFSSIQSALLAIEAKIPLVHSLEYFP